MSANNLDNGVGRRTFIGGSDARTIMGADETALLRLWREKRGEVEPQDLSANLIVQLGNATEDLNRRWYESNTATNVKDVQRRVRHPINRWMGATLDGLVEGSGAVYEAKFMLPWSFSEEGAARKHMAQLQHNMWVGSRGTSHLGSQASPETAALGPTASVAERDRLLGELGRAQSLDDLTRWAESALPLKNTLTAADAVALEATFANRLKELSPPDAKAEATAHDVQAPADQTELTPAKEGGPCTGTHEPPAPEGPDGQESVSRAGRSPRKSKERGLSTTTSSPAIDKSVLAFPEPRRIRNKEHLRLVAGQPCLICGRTPCDAHHLRFAQLRALGRKVSDEYTVPLCRGHHHQLHQTGNEPAFWERLGIDALEIARSLWVQSRGEAETMQSQHVT